MLHLTTNGSDWLGEKSLTEMTVDELAREGARRILVEALAFEVAEYIEAMKHVRDEDGRALVVRNGYSKPRKITVGSGTIEIAAPRVNDRRQGKEGEEGGRSSNNPDSLILRVFLCCLPLPSQNLLSHR